ncbi:putative ammonium transporter 2 [Sesbania bispinosa]|nr:putative ammonium transporter 2 [Sesbania bispinosa]
MTFTPGAVSSTIRKLKKMCQTRLNKAIRGRHNQEEHELVASNQTAKMNSRHYLETLDKLAERDGGVQEGNQLRVWAPKGEQNQQRDHHLDHRDQSRTT